MHNGITFAPEEMKPLRLNPRCGFVLHILNQFNYRDFNEDTVEDTAWQWVLLP